MFGIVPITQRHICQVYCRLKLPIGAFMSVCLLCCLSSATKTLLETKIQFIHTHVYMPKAQPSCWQTDWLMKMFPERAGQYIDIMGAHTHAHTLSHTGTCRMYIILNCSVKSLKSPSFLTQNIIQQRAIHSKWGLKWPELWNDLKLQSERPVWLLLIL